MKICISVHSLNAGGGIQERRVTLANEWTKLGYDVTIVCPVKPKKSIQKLSNSVRVVYLGRWQDKVRFHLLLGVIPLANFFKKEAKFDAVLASGPAHIFLTSIALLLARNKSPLYATIHGAYDYIGEAKQPVVSFVARLCLRFSSKMVTKFAGVSRGVASQVQEILAFRRDRIEVLYNPVIVPDMAFNESKINRSIYASPGSKIILAVGRLNRQKGFDLLIEAFSRIKTDSVLLIVGDGDDDVSLNKQAVTLGVEKRIQFLGYQPDVLSFMKMADCFVLSSRWEGLPNVVIEALYANSPVVSFDCPYGAAEILEYGKWGSIVKPGDIVGLANEIEIVLLKNERNFNDRWKDFYSPSIAVNYLKFMNIAS